MSRIKLSELPIGIKIAFICFYLFTVLGFLFAHLIIYFKLDGSFTPKDIIDYYKGNEALLKFQKTPLELSETAHFHSFISPLIALALSIFFSFTRLKETFKNLIILLSFISVLLLIINPWLLTFSSSLFVYLKYLSSFILIFTFLFMGALVICEFFKSS